MRRLNSFEELVLITVDNLTDTRGKFIQEKMEQALGKKLNKKTIYNTLHRLRSEKYLVRTTLPPIDGQGSGKKIDLLTPKALQALKILRRARRNLTKKTAA